MTTEERLARLEASFAEQKEDIKELRDDVRELLKVAHWGAGVGWTVLKVGAALVGLAAVLKVLVDMVRPH